MKTIAKSFLTAVEGDVQQVDLGDYAPGTYMLRMVTDNGLVTKQIIKE
jgi:hypothetical protein